MPIFYDPETGEYFRSNGNRVVETKRMGDLKTGGNPMDDGMDPMSMDEDMDEMPEDMPKKKGKAPVKKGK